MENENVRQSWEWETDFEHSFWLDIGEKEGVQSLEENKNEETARVPKRFAILSIEEMDKILEEKKLSKNRTNNKLVSAWQHLKVGISRRIFKSHADGSNNKM